MGYCVEYKGEFIINASKKMADEGFEFGAISRKQMQCVNSFLEDNGHGDDSNKHVEKCGLDPKSMGKPPQGVCMWRFSTVQEHHMPNPQTVLSSMNGKGLGTSVKWLKYIIDEFLVKWELHHQRKCRLARRGLGRRSVG